LVSVLDANNVDAEAYAGPGNCADRWIHAWGVAP
jgi:hypothetical protein